jgi:hypothetical protein
MDIPMAEHSSLKKPLLYALVVSVILGAILGIVLILRNTWGWFEVRIILTTAIVAGASLCGLACDLSKTPFGSNLLPKSGLVLTAIAAALLLLGIWSDIDSEAYWKSVISVSIFAVATVHVCLLSIAKLIGRFQWVYFIGCQIIYGLATLLTILILWEVNSDAMWRFVAALAIVVAALTLVIPILHRIGKMEGKRDELLMPVDARNVASIDEEIARLGDRITQLERLRIKIVGDEGKAV